MKEKAKELGGDVADFDSGQFGNSMLPQRPVGLLLESIHLQTAAFYVTMTILPQDAFTIDIVEAPVQQLAPLTKQLAIRTEQGEPAIPRRRPEA